MPIEQPTSYSIGMFRILNESVLSKPLTCIDLIFIVQINFITNSGVHSFLLSNCDPWITFSKFYLKIRYPKTNKPLFWNWEKLKFLLNQTSCYNEIKLGKDIFKPRYWYKRNAKMKSSWFISNFSCFFCFPFFVFLFLGKTCFLGSLL